MICPKCGSLFTYIKPDSNTYGCKSCEKAAWEEYENQRKDYINQVPKPTESELIAWDTIHRPKDSDSFSFGRVVGTEDQCPWCHSDKIVSKVYKRKKQYHTKTCNNSKLDADGKETIHTTEEYVSSKYEKQQDGTYAFVESKYNRKEHKMVYQVIEDTIIHFPYNLIFPLRQLSEFYKIKMVSK